MEQVNILLKKNEAREVEIDAAKGDQSLLVTVAEGATLALSVIGEIRDKKNLSINVGCEKGSTTHIVQKTFGSISVKYHIEMKGEDSACDIKCAFKISDEDKVNISAAILHCCPNTKGNIRIKGVCEGKSRADVSGMIKVEKNSQKTVSYFRDDILLFDDAMADSLPNLEIEANDVKASHGSTTSRINDDQLLYLYSRGISQQEARSLIIKGFLIF